MGFNFTYMVQENLLQGLLWLVSFKPNLFAKQMLHHTQNIARLFIVLIVALSRKVSSNIVVMMCVTEMMLQSIALGK